MAMARPIPRLAPVTKATGLFGGGKFRVDGLCDVFEGEGFDEWLSIYQNGGRLGDAARYAFLIVFLYQRSQPRVAKRSSCLGGIYAVILSELGQPLVEVIQVDRA